MNNENGSTRGSALDELKKLLFGLDEEIEEAEENTTDMVPFDEKYMTQFKSLAELAKQTKQIKKEYDAIKDELLQAMIDNNIKQVDNDFVKITRVDEQIQIGIDYKAFQMEAPEIYNEVKQNFSKETVKKPYLKITAK